MASQMSAKSGKTNKNLVFLQLLKIQYWYLAYVAIKFYPFTVNTFYFRSSQIWGACKFVTFIFYKVIIKSQMCGRQELDPKCKTLKTMCKPRTASLPKSYYNKNLNSEHIIWPAETEMEEGCTQFEGQCNNNQRGVCTQQVIREMGNNKELGWTESNWRDRGEAKLNIIYLKKDTK